MARKKPKRKPKGAKHKDKFSFGPSKHIGLVAGEEPSKRHARRLELNLRRTYALKIWCEQNGIIFEIKNDGHHWIFKMKDNPMVVEWWPSSAKLVINKEWENGVHVHDWEQASRVVAAAFDVAGSLS